MAQTKENNIDIDDNDININDDNIAAVTVVVVITIVVIIAGRWRTHATNNIYTIQGTIIIIFVLVKEQRKWQ